MIPDDCKVMAPDKRFFYYVGLGTKLGLVMLGSILAGLFFGMFLDQKLGLRGWFAVGFVLLGVVVGLYSAYRLIMGKKWL